LVEKALSPFRVSDAFSCWGGENIVSENLKRNMTTWVHSFSGGTVDKHVEERDKLNSHNRLRTETEETPDDFPIHSYQ
jgi:hypothetical protein